MIILQVCSFKKLGRKREDGFVFPMMPCKNYKRGSVSTYNTEPHSTVKILQIIRAYILKKSSDDFAMVKLVQANIFRLHISPRLEVSEIQWI